MKTLALADKEHRMDDLDGKFDRLDEKVDGLDRRVIRLDEKVDVLDKRVIRLDEKVDGLGERIGRVETFLDEQNREIRAEFRSIRGEIKFMQATMIGGFVTVLSAMIGLIATQL